MDSSAMRVFRSFMETPKKEGDSGDSLLCELSFLSHYDDWPEFAAMFLTQEEPGHAGKWYSTIGSHILSLSVWPYHSFGRFLKDFGHNAHRIGLASLELSYLGSEDCIDLALFISNATSLQQLSLEEQHYLPEELLRSLRHNPTVVTVTLPAQAESRLAHSYCQRNVHLGALLRSLVGDKWDNRNEDVTSMNCSVEDRSSKSSLPSLFQVAKQTSQKSLVLSGLLNLCESIGPFATSNLDDARAL
jgi:hypothetical protein